mmetsp:Transcript_12944/g.30703  ORF Transcript_12944/g.30703 Transcript_12944/m.30703 type:complete len:205 (+) Transcript_12944:87-701(+)
MTGVSLAPQSVCRGHLPAKPSSKIPPLQLSLRPVRTPSLKLRDVTAHAKKRKRPTMLERYGAGAGDEGDGEGGAWSVEEGRRWLDIGVRTSDFATKPTKPVLLANKEAVVVYKVGGKFYCSDAYSTAFKFPMSDANVTDSEDGPLAEVPLDGTVYNLRTGEVVKWCPKNNPIRFVLGSLKQSADPAPLTVYRARADGDKVMCLL